MSSAIVNRVRPASLLAAVIFLAVLAALPTTARAQAGPLGNPAGLTATPGPGGGMVTLSWTPAANAARHLVWAVRADGGGNRMQETERSPPYRPAESTAAGCGTTDGWNAGATTTISSRRRRRGRCSTR